MIDKIYGVAVDGANDFEMDDCLYNNETIINRLENIFEDKSEDYFLEFWIDSRNMDNSVDNMVESRNGKEAFALCKERLILNKYSGINIFIGGERGSSREIVVIYIWDRV